MALKNEAMCRSVRVRHWQGARQRSLSDAVAVEEPLEIRVNDLSLAVTMRTPGQDAELAVGFLATESILRGPDDLLDVTSCADPAHPKIRNIVNVYTAPERVPQDIHRITQRYANSSCGLCGRATIEEACAASPPLASGMLLSRDTIALLPERLQAVQYMFSKTGGLHAAGLFTAHGKLICAAEDVGRHNAADKVIGHALISGFWPLDEIVLMVSGRTSYEIVQKALAAKIPAVCAISAASTLAVDLARKSGMILIGFLRGESMNVYSGMDRVTS
jgi:FdhD protein